MSHISSHLWLIIFHRFSDNRNEPDRTHENSDTLWQKRDVFEILNDAFFEFYDPFINLAIDDIIVSFKEWVIFKQYIPPPKKKKFSAS